MHNVSELFTIIRKPAIDQPIPDLKSRNWKVFRYDELFEIKKGQRLTSQEMNIGETPYLGATNKNNGITSYIDRDPIHGGNVISVNYDGSIGEAYYQPEPFWCSDAVNVLYPKFEMNPFHAMFLVTLIRKERYRYNYGRKWGMERMKQSKIKLPVNRTDNPDWDFIESYIKTLKYSANL